MLESMTVDQPTLARVFGVSVRTVQRWGSEGLDETRVAGGATYDLPSAVAWYAERHVEQANGDASPDAYAEARTRKELALARLRELEVGQREGRLLDADSMVEAHREIAHRVKTAVMSWPAKMATDLAADLGVDPSDVGAALDGYVRHLLIELADTFKRDPADG